MLRTALDIVDRRCPAEASDLTVSVVHTPVLSMPMIIAICPYCRAGGVRAGYLAGHGATCPKCKSSFSVLPEANLPDWAANANGNSFSAPSPDKPKPARCTETRVPAISPTLIESTDEGFNSKTQAQEKQNADETGKDSRGPKAAPAAAHSTVAVLPATEAASEESRPAPPDMGMVLALAALILVGPAMLASQLPYGRIIAIPLAAVGCIAGLLCLGSEGKARLFAAGAVVANLIALLILLFLPSWLHLDPWGGPGGAADEQAKGPQRVDRGSGEAVPLSANEWLDPWRYSWQLGDIRISAQSLVAPVDLVDSKDIKRTSKKQYFQLGLEIRNVGVERELPLSGWAVEGTSGITVTDSSGHALEPARFEPGWSLVQTRQYSRAMPGHAVTLFLVYAALPAKTEYVRIQLAGSAVGVKEDIRFQSTLAAGPAHRPRK